MLYKSSLIISAIRLAMEPTKSDYIRISINSMNSCELMLTGISDPDATYDSSGSRMWIEVPIQRKHLLISLRFSKDVSFNILLGAHSTQKKDAPSILYKRLLINQELLLCDETAIGTNPTIVKYKAHKDEYLRIIVEWDVLDDQAGEQMHAIAPITAETIAGKYATVSCETESEKNTRIRNWNSLNALLKKEQRLIQPVEYIVIDSKRLIYIVNSKVANTSIKCSMSDDYFDDDYSIHGALTDHGISITELTEAQKEYFTFTFVRNPFSRLVSCYVSKYHTDIQIYKKEQHDMAYYLDGYLKYDEGFDRFIEKICEIPNRLMDRHFRLQHDIVFDEEGRCRCNYIGKFENLCEDFEPIRETFNLHSLPHYNTTHVENWMDFYTEESAKKVYDKYRPDFESFGYSFEYDKLLDYI